MDAQEDTGSVEQTVDTSAATQVADQVDNTGVEGADQNQQQNDATADADAQQEREANGQFKKPGVQTRIDELTRAKHEANREAAYWRTLAQNNGQAQTSAPAAPAKPTVDQYEDYGEYVEALTDWKADQAVAKRMEADSTRKVGEVRQQTFMERQSAYAKANPDYATALSNSTAPIFNHVKDAVEDSDVGPQLLHHFAKNPAVLERINGMDERQANREIGRLEAQFASTKAAAPAAPSKKVTQAPAPAGTQSTQGRSTVPDLANASMDEYMAQRKSQGARWSR